MRFIVGGAALVGVGCYLMPLMWFLYNGVRLRLDALAIPPTWRSTLTIESLVAVLGSSDAQHALFNSLLVALLATMGSLLFGVPAAYSLSTLPRRSAAARSFLLLTNAVVPPISLLIPLYLLLRQFGLLESRLALSFVHVGLTVGIVVVFLEPVFRSLPRRVHEMAALDGLSPASVVWRVLIPLSLSGVLMAGAIVFVLSWGEYTMASMTAGGRSQTLPVLLPSLVQVTGTRWGEAAVLSFLTFLPLGLLALLGPSLFRRVRASSAARSEWTGES